MINGPRSAADFRLIDYLVRAGNDSKTILNLFKNDVWRSEIISLAGQFHCAQCNQKISLHECMNCGQTIHERNDLHERR